MMLTAPASARCVYSTTELRSTPGTTLPLQKGQPCRPEPPGPQPRPESDTRTTPPTMINTKVASAVARTSRLYPREGTAFTLDAARRDRLRHRLRRLAAREHLAADVLHRLDAAHARDRVEVVRRRRRGREPLERVAVPGIVAGALAVLDRVHHVHER